MHIGNSNFAGRATSVGSYGRTINVACTLRTCSMVEVISIYSCQKKENKFNGTKFIMQKVRTGQQSNPTGPWCGVSGSNLYRNNCQKKENVQFWKKKWKKKVQVFLEHRELTSTTGTWQVKTKAIFALWAPRYSRTQAQPPLWKLDGDHGKGKE